MRKKKATKTIEKGIRLAGDGLGVGFGEFIVQPQVSAAILIIGLVALTLAILDFSRALGY